MPTSIHSVRGAAGLLFDCVIGVTGVVERMHATIARRSPAWVPESSELPSSPPGTAGRVYSVLRGTAGLVRQGVDRSLQGLPEPPDPPSESMVVSGLNGVCGDHLEATGNPLAIRMHFRTPERKLELTPAGVEAALGLPSRRVVVLVHGLCLSERMWRRGGRICLGTRLRDGLGYTPLYLRYNTGRHISTNGQELAERLDDLLETWPVPIDELVLVGHSMGGLVVRSACFYAQRQGRPWLDRLERVVCLGTPHHGAPLEKAGHLLTALMKRSPYVDPLALGQRRSAGIKDLRHGNLLDEDWQGRDPDAMHPDARRVVPLLPGVEYYFVAATVGRSEFDVRGHLLGDLLVRLGSAVGSHPDDLRRIRVRPEHCRVFHGRHHFDLLHDPSVHAQILEWFAERSGVAPPGMELADS